MQTYSLTLTQSCPPTPGQDAKQPFHIPIKLGLLDSGGQEVPLQMNGQKLGTSSVVELKQTTETFTFNGVTEPPTPSLLRDFSAPVKMHYEYSKQELLHLMKYDPNLFNRWEAGQKLFLGEIKRVYQGLVKKETPELSAEFVSAFGHNLMESGRDRLFASRMLAPPNTKYLEQFFSPIDPDLIAASHLYLVRSLAQSHKDTFQQVYEDSHLPGDYVFNEETMAYRYLKNLCLKYLVSTEDPAMIQLAFKQYHSANNMTDVQATLSALNHIDCEERRKCMEDFYMQWKTDSVVFNDWLSLQATSYLPGALGRQRQILKDPNFDIDNPHRAISLMARFAYLNPQFHALDGEAYEFIAERTLELDQKNPQMGSRMAGAFENWKKYDPERSQLMKKSLIQIQQSPGLSKNTYEIVSNALKQ